MKSCTKQRSIASCPFALTDESEQIQNYGCLPTPYDILQMRLIHGKTWACHSDSRKPCLGALEYLKELNLPFKVIDQKMVTLDDNWGEYTKGGFDDIHRMVESARRLSYQQQKGEELQSGLEL